MRQFENNDDVNELSSDSSQESDKKFYSQYVQGTEPRSFVGLPNESKDSNDDKMSVGEYTAIGSNADVNVSDSQKMSNKKLRGQTGEYEKLFTVCSFKSDYL